MKHLVWISYFCAALAVLLNRTVVRAIPGGPFISISGDLLPITLASLSILTGILDLTSKKRIAGFSAISILISLVVTTDVVVGILSFWFSPSARGQLIDW